MSVLEDSELVYNTRNYWVSGLCPSSNILKNTKFRKLGLFPSSDEMVGASTLLDQIEIPNFNPMGPLERRNLSYSVSEAGSISILRWKGGDI
jgi:hypothetical protein